MATVEDIEAYINDLKNDCYQGTKGPTRAEVLRRGLKEVMRTVPPNPIGLKRFNSLSSEEWIERTLCYGGWWSEPPPQQGQLKMTQVVAYLVKRGVNVLAEIKTLLVLADEASTTESGTPMGMDYDHPHPLVKTLRVSILTTGVYTKPSYWSPFISIVGNPLVSEDVSVEVVKDPGEGLLSEFEVEILDRILREREDQK